MSSLNAAHSSIHLEEKSLFPDEKDFQNFSLQTKLWSSWALIPCWGQCKRGVYAGGVCRDPL